MLIQATDLVLTNLGVDADNAPDIVMPLAPSQLSVAGTELTLRFGPNQLTDGVYQLEILPTATNLSGVPLDGDGDGFGGDAFVYRGNEANAFYRLQVDWHPDGGASIFDFPVFRYWFGIKDRPLPEYVDLNGDGGVSIFDFPRIVANFGRAIVFPSGLAGASGAESEPPLADRPGDESMLVEPVAPSRLWAPARGSVPKRPTDAVDVDRSLQVESALDDIVLDIALQWNGR
jgi:hypothetical protein